MKLLRLFLLGILCAFASQASAQLTIGTVDPGPYTPGSNIAVTFSIDPATCIPLGNTFYMYLSDAAGNFNAPLTQIGQYNGFYSTYVNGIIPAGTAPGGNYRIRIVASSNGLSAETGFISINALPTVTANIVSSRPIPNSGGPTNMHAFGFCSPTTGASADIVLSNQSSAAATATITNEIDNSVSTVTINPQITYRPDIGHYTMFVKVTMPNGTVATRAYFIINSTTVTSLNTSGANTVCLPGGTLSYAISQTAYERNFPGNTYQVNWGDNTSNTYTHCEIMQNGAISHTYTFSSCGQTNVNGSITTYNAFGINLQTVNPFCGNVGTPISTTARVINATENRFTGPLYGCSNADVTFVNTSIMGDNPNNNSPQCLPDNSTFNWYVDNVLVLAGVSRNDNLVYRFTRGNHVVRLESTSPTGCTTPDVTQTICIQDPPVPTFTLAQNRVCSGTLIKPTNTSFVDAICNTSNGYTWVVSPGVTFINGTNANSAEPEFLVTATGIYEINLLISTATCGTVVSPTQQIIVDATPSANLSADVTLCNLATYDFNPTTPGPTRTELGGTPVELANTYTWTITGGQYNLIGSNLNSQYPRIQFLDFATYTITVTHQNSCGTTSDTQIISFTPAPTVNAGIDFNICYGEPNVILNGSVNGAAVISSTWVGGAGTFAPDRNALNATYTPTTAERIAGQVNLTLRTTTSLPTPCNVIEDYVTINIRPEVTVTSANAKTICTGTAVAYTPTSATAGTTFTWTATGSANATGFSATGNGNINDVITNTDATVNATVTYMITPFGNGCSGTPFTFTVTVTPNPIVTPTAANSTICSQQNAGITLNSNLPNTRYTWTSTVTGSITGNTTNATPSSTASINDLLINNGTSAGTVTYTITPISSNNCSGTAQQIVITVEPQPTAPNAGADQNICNQTTYTLQGNTLAVGSGRWTLVPANPAVTFDDDTSPTATASGLQAGNTYVFRWTSTGAASCTPKTDDVTIIVAPVSSGGTTSGSQSVCAVNNSGQITLTTQVGTVIAWESSPDGATWTTIPNETGTSLTYNNLIVTTHYRAIVQSGSCAPSTSTVSIITVNQTTTISNAGPDQTLCNVNSATLNGNAPNPNTGLWTLTSGQTGVTFTDAALPNTTVSGLVAGQTYTFRWTITGFAPCPPSIDEVNITIDLPSNGGTTMGSTSVCAGNNNGNISVSGFTGNIVEWQSSTDGFANFTTIASTATSIPYLNLNTTTQYRAVIRNGVCSSAFSTIATITVNQNAVAANAGLDQTLCDATSVTLAGNDPLGNSGQWTLVSGPPGFTITNPSLYNTTVTGLAGGASYIFRWTISGLPPCGATSDDVSIVNLPPLQNNAINTANTTSCTGQTITIVGSQPSGGNGSYTYLWESSPTGTAPWSIVLGQTSRDLNVNVTSSLFYRRTVNSGTCSTSSNTLSIIALPPVGSNTIAQNQTICLTQTPTAIIGSQATGGDGVNYTYNWEQSLDGLVWTAVPGANAQNYTPPAITQTTQYRRLVSSGACTGAQQNISNAITITVNLNARAEFTYTSDIGCVPYVLDASNIQAIPYPSQNGTYTWFADGVQIGTGITFPGYTINTYNTDVVIRLVVTSNSGCLSAEMSHTFRTRENILASFTPSVTEGCGPLSVTFTNTTPVAVGNTYEWFIDGVSSSTARDFGTRLFDADPAGRDKIYNIRLVVSSNCGTNEITHALTVKANPIPAISAVNANGCSPFNAEFINTSPGAATNTYIIDFGDGSAPETHVWGNPIRHTYTTTVVRDFEVRMTATNTCATVTSAPIIVRVSPNSITPVFFASPTQQTVCVGVEVSFRNNTSGAKDFLYDFKDGTSTVFHPNAYVPETITHRFLQAGTYDVVMTASNDCSTNSAIQRIIVLETPTAVINADITTGCAGLRVSFTQTNTGAVSYLWDFGDGTTSTDANPTHSYNVSPGQYNVTLTVINSLGCSFTTTRQNYITIVGPPTVNFAISPAAVISIPEYTFKFTNESANGAQTYRWSFGDGDISTQRDPSHTYLDTGRYLVTLRAYNEYGCVDSIQKYVQIVGIPGYTFVPNAFVPGGTSVPLQKFMGVGSGMKSWRMTIFNKWGQVLWETTKLEDGKPVEGWDGTYKGVPQPQGIYFWKIEVELLNGSEWKGMSLGNAPPRRTGEIYLIR